MSSYKTIEVKTINIPGFGSYTGPIKVLESKLPSGKQVTKSTKSPRPLKAKGGMMKKKSMGYKMGGMMKKKKKY